MSAFNAVTVGGIAVTSLVWDSPNQIRCTIPASGSAGWNDVVVTTARGGTGLDTVQYLHADPVITSVAPTTGPIAGGYVGWVDILVGCGLFGFFLLLFFADIVRGTFRHPPHRSRLQDAPDCSWIRSRFPAE